MFEVGEILGDSSCSSEWEHVLRLKLGDFWEIVVVRVNGNMFSV